jgi:hypothetical protein
MRRWGWLLTLMLPLCLNCEDEQHCETLCDELNACGFLPSPMGVDLDNCVARCESSDDIPKRLESCIKEQPPHWQDLSGEKTGDPVHDRAMDLFGCPTYAECLSHITRDSNLQGHGRVMMVPTETAWSGVEQKRDLGCQAQVKLRDAEEICSGWGVARATALLDDGQTGVRGSFSTCATALVHQAVFDHILVTRLRAALVLEGKIEATGEGGAPPQAAGASGAGQGDGGSDGNEPSEPCFVFPAPLQVNDAGPGCVGIVLPFDRDIKKANVCERGVQCTDNLDNDADGWSDCDDPKCEEYCKQFMSVAPAADAGGAGPNTSQP